MNIESIKQLIKNGEFPQAHDQLKQFLSRTPNDPVAQMLYGTCCQILGDSRTFGRIYQRLAPEMERCVKSGEQSERTRMWVKYAAMFAMILTFGFQGCSVQDTLASPESDDRVLVEKSPSVTPCELQTTLLELEANSRKVQRSEDESSLYQRVQKMPLKEKFRYFLERQDVKEQLPYGEMRVVVIPLQSSREGQEQENLLLIRTKGDLKSGADVVKALKEMPKERVGDSLSVRERMIRARCRRMVPLTWFSPFERITWTDNGTANTNGLWRSRTIHVDFMERSKHDRRVGELKKTIQCLEEHGDITDLIVSSEEQDYPILGICFVGVCSSAYLEDYLYSQLDDGGDYVRRVVLPQGAVVYELTEEAFRKKMEERKEMWARVLKMSLQEKFRYFLERQDVKEQLPYGEMRVVVIPLQSSREDQEQENLLLIRTKGDLKSGADVVKAPKAMSKRAHLPFVVFSSFERNVWTTGNTANTSGVWELKEFSNFEGMDFAMRQGVEKTIECIEKHGDISDLIVSPEGSDCLILGIYFVNVHGSMARTKHGGPRDWGDRFPKWVKSPKGKVVYELTEEMVRKRLEEKRKQWENMEFFQ